MIIPIIIFLYCAYALKLNPSEKICAKVSKNLKIGMLINYESNKNKKAMTGGI